MNYLKLYVKICQKTKNRLKNKDEIYEKHHVFPKSIYGKNSFLINLTVREHYIAHRLLLKAFILRYGENHYKTAKMAMAVHKMIYRISKFILNPITNSRMYEIARKAVVLAKTGKKRNDMLGKSFFGADSATIQHAVEKMVAKKKGQRINYPSTRKKRKQLKETNQKISDSRKNTLIKYTFMTLPEFKHWISNTTLFMKDGRKNGNVTRAIIARQERIEDYYD
jgi:hypothetical protein